MEIQNFSIEFVRRTKEILQDYSGKRDMTLLLNCTLGLIILPYEKGRSSRNQRIWKTSIEDIKELHGVQIDIFNPIKYRHKTTKQLEYYPKNLESILRKIRNGIAHQHIEPVNADGEFCGVVVKNYWEDKQNPDKIMDLHITFTQTQLHLFSLFIADLYLGDGTHEY